MELRELQHLIREAITGDQTRVQSMAAAGPEIEPTAGMSGREHLAIYRNAVLGTMLRAMANIYPVCRQLVGEDFFDAMARRYVRHTPSQSPDLGDYGASFADFIADFEPAAALEYLPDVARLEWCWHTAFHATDESGLDIGALGAVPEHALESIRFRMPVSASLLDSDYPIHRIWQVNQPDWSGDQSVDLDEGGVRLIIWRQGYDMRVDPLSEMERQFLGEIAAGRTLRDMGEKKNAPEIETLLPRCVQRGWIAGFELTGQNGES
jgi:hypothetical protein